MGIGNTVAGIMGAGLIYKAADSTIERINRGCKPKKKKKKWRIW